MQPVFASLAKLLCVLFSFVLLQNNLFIREKFTTIKTKIMQNDFEKLNLKKIDITGNLLGKFSTFSIQQEYTNSTNDVLIVIYSFPISASATVTGFSATVGDKTIRGKTMEKELAEKEYHKAMLKGDSAYMMTKAESNIFKMNIGKIAVGETVSIKIDYIDTLEIIDNKIRIHIPTLVAPRYNSETTEKLNYVKNEVEYRGNICIKIDKCFQTDDIASKTHSIKVENNIVTARNIKLDCDFVLEIKLAEKAFSKGCYCDLTNGNKVVYLSFLPDIECVKERTRNDYVFVIDYSGSMMGAKIERTKEAVIKCLNNLSEGDRFNIINFGYDIKQYSTSMINFTPQNFESAKKFILNQDNMGGTELFRALTAAIRLPEEAKTIFLFTDGQVGNESQIAEYIRQNIGNSALFVFGIDSSVNKNGLTEMATAGRGKAEFILEDEQIKESIVRQFSRVSSANLFDVKLDGKANRIVDKIEKQRVLFNREFYDILIETDEINDDFSLLCTLEDKTFSFDISKNKLEHSSLPIDKIFAAEKIKRIEKYIAAQPNDTNSAYKEEIAEIAVANGIDSRYTAFVAVNERDEKITEIPFVQNIVLEKPKDWEVPTRILRMRLTPPVLNPLQQCKVGYNRMFDTAIAEIRGGRKKSDWMNSIFPQIAGLAYSDSQYSLIGLAEARSFLFEAGLHLKERLEQICEALLNLPTNNAEDIFDSIDAQKLQSSMTLFSRVKGASPIFQHILDKFFAGQPDEQTLDILRKNDSFWKRLFNKK
jgi:Ca-activated chloride channel family protein